MTRASRSGTALKRIGVTLIVAGLMMPGIMMWPLILYIGMDERRAGLFMSLLTGFLAAGGLFLLWRGRQYAAKADAERIVTDSNPRCCTCEPFGPIPQLRGTHSCRVTWGWGWQPRRNSCATHCGRSAIWSRSANQARVCPNRVQRAFTPPRRNGKRSSSVRCKQLDSS
jgi:hypothetical protein